MEKRIAFPADINALNLMHGGKQIPYNIDACVTA